MHDHITKVKMIREQLAVISHRVNSVQLAPMMLHRLSRSYHGFVTMVTVGERTRPLTFDELAPLLLQEEGLENLYNKSEEKP